MRIPYTAKNVGLFHHLVVVSVSKNEIETTTDWLQQPYIFCSVRSCIIIMAARRSTTVTRAGMSSAPCAAGRGVSTWIRERYN